jgi:hypothetical protein
MAHAVKIRGGQQLPVRAIVFAFLAMPPLIMASPVSAEQWLCVADSATGFRFDKQRSVWVQATFATTEKYVVSRAEKGRWPKAADGQEVVWVVTKTGSDFPSHWCTTDFTENGALICKGIGSELLLSRENLRYLLTYTIGYWNEVPKRLANRGRQDLMGPEGSNTPHVEIGRCSKF